MLTCFRLTKGHATYFRPETIVTSFLQLMVLIIQSVIQQFLKTPVYGGIYMSETAPHGKEKSAPDCNLADAPKQ